ncbi:MAG: hypothetical protein A3K10_13015 [Bacteroidetes bacterium RIFCSPLOWO2_12_FULL_31_6]|nr:MAG: hypothetical protein A3K10_13015 [Bacteroidetes bacterium RIFCSPLOWO2_12_FULL_31_6]
MDKIVKNKFNMVNVTIFIYSLKFITILNFIISGLTIFMPKNLNTVVIKSATDLYEATKKIVSFDKKRIR